MHADGSGVRLNDGPDIKLSRSGHSCYCNDVNQYNLFHAGVWGSIALSGHSSRSLLNLYTNLAGQKELIVFVDIPPRSLKVSKQTLNS